MAQSVDGAARKKKFSKAVTLIKRSEDCISFGDIRKVKNKSKIEFTTVMSKEDVRKKIQETFKYLEKKR